MERRPHPAGRARLVDRLLLGGCGNLGAGEARLGEDLTGALGAGRGVEALVEEGRGHLVLLDRADDHGEEPTAVALGAGHEGVTGCARVSGLETGGAGEGLEHLVVVHEAVVFAVAAVELVDVLLHDRGDLGDFESVAAHDCQVVGAGLRAALESLLAVEARRVEPGAVAHAEAVGGALHESGEAGQITPRGLGQGVGRVVRRHHEQGVEQVLQFPHLSFLEADAHGRLSRRERTHVDLVGDLELFEGHEGGHDLDQAGHEVRFVVVERGEHRTTVEVDQHPRLGLRAGGTAVVGGLGV